MNGQKIGVAACLDLARLGPGRSHISRFETLFFVLGNKFLYRSILQVRILVLDCFLVCLVIGILGILTAVKRLILVFQEV